MLTEVERANTLRRTDEQRVTFSEPGRLRKDTNKDFSKTKVECNKIRLKLGSML